MKTAGKSGYLLLNKQPGQSSFGSLGLVKKAFSTGKVCHTGTLDTFAQGLLVVLVGRAVKLASWFSGCDKRYRGRIKFGEETSTLDPEGEIVGTAPLPSEEALLAALPAFTGTILQAPPLYSAIHVNGERAHELARRGIQVEMKRREITVYELSVSRWDPPHADIEVFCSKGTYIRSLARDLALAVSSRGHLVSLTRISVGGFSLEGAVSPAAMEKMEGGTAFEQAAETLVQELKPINRELFSLLGIPCITVDAESAASIRHGVPLTRLLERLAFPEGTNRAALFGPLEDAEYFAGIIEKKPDVQRAGSIWKYGYVNAEN